MLASILALLILPYICCASAQQRLINAIGTNAYELGVSIGRQQRESILELFETRKAYYSKKYNEGEWEKLANATLPAIVKHAPTTLEEMRGVADGAKVPLVTLLQLATDYEMLMGFTIKTDTVIGKCTGFGWANSSSGNVFCGQNNDEIPDDWLGGKLDAVVARSPVSSVHGKSTAVVSYSHPGIPAYMGTNGAGLSVLWQYIDNGGRAPSSRTPTVPTCVLLREVLQFSDLSLAVSYLRQVPKSCPNNFMLTQPGHGIVNLEMSPSHFTAVSVPDGEIAHSNHIIFDQEMQDTDRTAPDGGDQTRERLAVIKAYLKDHRKEFQTFDANAGQGALSQPVVLNNNTLASMVFGPDCGQMRIRFRGDPEGEFQHYSVPCAPGPQPDIVV